MTRPPALDPTPERDLLARARHDPKLANAVYHDWEASSYDEKWSISYDERCIKYARDRFEQVAGKVSRPFPRALEIGAGTGFFTVNLVSAGIIESGCVTDLSAGMVDVALRNGSSLGYELDGRVADAEHLPFADGSFDLVCGHAVLHHVPDLDQALREVIRVLRPGGRFVFAGEPTRHGALIARRLSRTAWSTTEALSRTSWWRDRFARTADELVVDRVEAALEAIVDIHTFDPDELHRLCLRAGAVDVITAPSEFTASWFGWPVRTVEAAVRPGSLGWRWTQFAYRGWAALAWMDERIWERLVPDKFFYNVSVAGAKPIG